MYKVNYIFPDDNSTNFVGIKIEENNLNFYLPKGYILDQNNNLNKDLILIIKSIIAYNESVNQQYIYGSKRMDIIENIPIKSFLWLMQDYLSNGIFKKNTIIHKLNANGRIIWKKTMQNNFYISNGNHVFIDLVTQTKTKTDHLISKIHYTCLSIINNFLGPIFGYLDINDPIVINENLFESYLIILKEELSKTFNDRIKLLIINLIEVLKGAKNNDKIISNKELYGTKNYEYVWQMMVDKHFGNIKDINKYYPSAVWYLKNRKPITTANLLLDTLRIEDDYVMVIDSKYYGKNEKVLSNLPTISDMNKQVAYIENVAKILQDKDYSYYNLFILPGTLEKNNIQYEGYAIAKWKHHYKKFDLFILDVNYILNKWKFKVDDITLNYMIKSSNN